MKRTPLRSKELLRSCQEKEREVQKEYRLNRRQIARIYRTEFALLEGYIDYSLELGRLLDSYIPGKEKPFLQFSLLRIQEHSIKVAREAKILLENGSGSGAMARWRTLFEFAVVSNYLIKYPDLAEKYVMYVFVDDYKYARRLVEFKDKLELFDCDLSAFPEIKQDYESVKEKYQWTGKSYEWARNEDVKNPDLLSMARATGLEHFYAYVDEAHLYNHPSMHYLLHDRGGQPPEEQQHYLFSPFDLEVPCQLIASSLHQVNGMAILGYSKLENADSDTLLLYSGMNLQFTQEIIKAAKKRGKADRYNNK